MIPGMKYDDQLKEENVHGGLILQGFVHLGALPSNPQFEGGMHKSCAAFVQSMPTAIGACI
jgi:hypothetical protein